MKKKSNTMPGEAIIVPGKQPNVKLVFTGGNGIEQGYALLAKEFIAKHIQEGKIIPDEPIVKENSQ